VSCLITSQTRGARIHVSDCSSLCTRESTPSFHGSIQSNRSMALRSTSWLTLDCTPRTRLSSALHVSNLRAAKQLSSDLDDPPTSRHLLSACILGSKTRNKPMHPRHQLSSTPALPSPWRHRHVPDQAVYRKTPSQHECGRLCWPWPPMEPPADALVHGALDGPERPGCKCHGRAPLQPELSIATPPCLLNT